MESTTKINETNKSEINSITSTATVNKASEKNRNEADIKNNTNVNSISTDKINARQIFFILILSITIKLFMLPTMLATEAKHDLWVSAIMLFGFEMLIFGVVAFIFVRKHNSNIGQMLESTFGQRMGKILSVIVHILLAFYFFIKVALLVLEQHNLLDTVLYRSFNIFFMLIPFLVIAVFIASKGLRAVARVSDFLFFPIIIGVIAMLVLSVTIPDYTNFMPFFEEQSGIFWACINNHIYFGDSLVLLLLLGATTSDRANNKADADKTHSILKRSTVALTASFVGLLVFCILFTNIFYNLTPMHNNAIASTTKYSLPLMFLGGISWVPLTLVHMGSIFYTAILFYFGVRSMHALYPKATLSLFALIKAALVLIFIMIFSKTFFDMYDLYLSLKYILLGIIAFALVLLFAASLKGKKAKPASELKLEGETHG